MGANWLTIVYDDKPEPELRRQFDDRQRRDAWENGNMYSGSFNMANGLIFLQREPFERQSEAEDHLIEICQKWREAQAVRFKEDDGKIKWLVGAWCAC